MDEMREVAEGSKMADIVFMTVVGQNVFYQSWNQTDDMFEEPTPGLLSTIFGLNKTGIFVYNRCGSLEGELQLFPLVPLNPSDIRHEWKVIENAYRKCPQCNKPAPKTRSQAKSVTP